jgi:hypothetical protein
MNVLPALLAFAAMLLAPSYAQAQDATSSTDTRADIWITCYKSKGNNEQIVNVSDCNSLHGRMQAGFECYGEDIILCGDYDLTCRDLGGYCVSPQGEKCYGYLNGECQPPCKCSIGGGGGGTGRCSRDLAALNDCYGLPPGTLSCAKAPYPANKFCPDVVNAVNLCCEKGGGGGAKCEGDGTKCDIIRLCDKDEVNVCIQGKSICCDPTGGGGGGGNSCDLTQPIICDANYQCSEGWRLRRCNLDSGPGCKGGIAYQCVEMGGGGGGGSCEVVKECTVLCQIGTVCVDCDGDGIGESCQ